METERVAGEGSQRARMPELFFVGSGRAASGTCVVSSSPSSIVGPPP